MRLAGRLFIVLLIWNLAQAAENVVSTGGERSHAANSRCR